MRKPRHLSSEERALWDRVAERATPLHPTREEPAPDATPMPKPKRFMPQPDPMPDFQIGHKADAARPHDIMRPLVDRLGAAPVNMDNKSFGKMKRGKLKPEARIDLHGMTLAQAHPALTRFILGAVAEERRLVLVITGKGRVSDESGPIPERHGVLRHQVPHWLHSMPLKLHVLQIAEAHVKHGGAGAYYVYLRRVRG